MSPSDAPSIISPLEIACIIYRRIWWLVVPALLGLAGAVAFVMASKPVYRSAATLLIDSQQISTTVVASPLTNQADDRIAKIRQQVTSRANLIRLIEEMELYPEERARLPIDQVQDKMRQAIAVDLVSARPNERAAGSGSTIAFTLSFTYGDPTKAHDVTEALTGMFLTEDKRLRTEQASGAASFLQRRAEELRRQLVELEQRRRTVEARYTGALPAQVALSAQTEGTLRSELSRIDSETQGILQQNSLMAARGADAANAPSAEADGVRRAEERVAQLSATYADDFPEVIAAKAALERQRAMLRPRASTSNVITSEIAAGRARIATLASRRAELASAIAATGRRTAMAPQAAYELSNIEREYDNLKSQYQEIREKQMEAQVAANLQSEDKGERFSVVDPPSLSFDPLGPKHIQVLLIGPVAGLAFGFGLVVLWQIAAGPINSKATITRIMGAPPLVVVPVLRSGNAGKAPLRRLWLPARWRSAA